MDVSQKTTAWSRFFLFSSAFSATLLTLTPTSVHSVTQGTIGATSSASMTITLIIPPRLEARVANNITVNNPPLPSSTGFNNAVPLCVTSNGFANYTVTASGHTEEGQFALQNGNSLVPYDILIKKRADGDPKPLYSGQPSYVLKALNKQQKCEGSSQLALKMRQPLNPALPVAGAINLTIGAD